MKASLRLASLALLGAALLSSQATADIRQWNPDTGVATVTPTRPANGDLFESAVPPAAGLGTPYKGSSSAAELVDPVIFSQPPTVLDGAGYFSDAVPGQFYAQRVADDFTTPGGPGWVLTGARWWGASEFFLFPDYTNMASFTVEIYADAGGVPGASLTGPMVYATAATSPTVVGSGFAGQDVYVQEVDFPGVVVPGGAALWVSVGATLDAPFDDAWVWQLDYTLGTIAAELSGNGGVGSGYVSFSGLDQVSFEISGHRVPEPGSIALCSIGALALGYATLRRKR